MELTPELLERLDLALTEADVVGIRPGTDAGDIDVLLHVLALTEHSPMDPDGRRILRLQNVSDLAVVLRRDGPGRQQVLPLRDLDAVEAFFASLSQVGSLYGSRYFDDPSLVADWPETPSLHLSPGGAPARHSFYWFNECGTGHDETYESYIIEGTVTFESLQILRADRHQQDVEEFVEQGARWWQQFQAHDPRTNGEAQRAAAHGPRWRTPPARA